MRRTRHRRYLTLLGLTIGLAMVLTSCFGGDDETEDTTNTTQASTPTTTQAASVETPTTTQVVVVETPTTTQAVFVETPTTTQAVVVETPTPPPTRGPGEILVYTVAPGDTLFSIATQFGVTVDELVELNNIADPNVIFVEDELQVPPPG